MEGVNSTMIFCKNLCKCHSVPHPPPGTTIKKQFFSQLKKECIPFTKISAYYEIIMKLLDANFGLFQNSSSGYHRNKY
jgi:hypothetical protein